MTEGQDGNQQVVRLSRPCGEHQTQAQKHTSATVTPVHACWWMLWPATLNKRYTIAHSLMKFTGKNGSFRLPGFTKFFFMAASTSKSCFGRISPGVSAAFVCPLAVTPLPLCNSNHLIWLITDRGPELTSKPHAQHLYRVFPTFSSNNTPKSFFFV